MTMGIIESIGWGVTALVFSAVISIIVKMWLEPNHYDKPTNTDTLFRGAKQCHNCRHSEISTVFPELACPVLGKHVEPHHFCDEWA